MSDHELISDRRTSVLSDLLVPYRESPPAIFGSHSPSIGSIEERIGGNGGSSLYTNTIFPLDRPLPKATEPTPNWSYTNTIFPLDRPLPKATTPTPDWKEGEDGWEYCGPLAVIGKIPYPDWYHRPTPPIKTDWREGEDGWEYCGPLAVVGKIAYPDGYRPSTAPFKIHHETLPSIQGETPGSARNLPWIQGETPGSARILPWIQPESSGSGILPGMLPSAPGRTELLRWHEKPRSSWPKMDPKISAWLDQQACLLSSVEKP